MKTRDGQVTRERLLQTAFQEIHAHGFQGMRVDEILRRTGLQKGAFYHHFSSKTDLGYTVLEEQIRPLIETTWIAPFSTFQDPVLDLPHLLDELGEHMSPAMYEHGCPLNNLAQEMTAQDEGFRRRIAQLFADWIGALETALERGKAGGYIRDDVDSRAVAQFVVAALEGGIGVFKVMPSPALWSACRSQIAVYLLTLRPEPH